MRFITVCYKRDKSELISDFRFIYLFKKNDLNLGQKWVCTVKLGFNFS